MLLSGWKSVWLCKLKRIKNNVRTAESVSAVLFAYRIEGLLLALEREKSLHRFYTIQSGILQLYSTIK